MSKIKCRHKIFIGIAILTVLLNVLAWNSTVFCDAYIAYVFPVWVNTYGRFTGLFPFSVGEWMIGAGAVLLLFAAFFSAVLGLTMIVSGLRRLRHGMTGCRRPAAADINCFSFWKGKTGRFVEQRDVSRSVASVVCRFYTFFAWTLLIVCLVQTLNCFILYHASTFSQKYFGEDTAEHSLEELFVLYNRIGEQVNRLSVQVPRNEAGEVLYPEEAKDANAMKDKAVETMQSLGKTYPQLDGYYPRPKALLSSDFMCQQYMQGYYFPFSMEANYNDVMYILNKPSTMCHELAHLRGYIFEDEANFISYLACIQSDDIVFQYSGYLSVFPYVINDLNKEIAANPEACEEVYQKTGLVRIDSQVYADDVFVTDEEWERINGKAIIDTETVDEISDAFVDTTLKINGVKDGSVSYSRVVKLLLQYYGK